MTDKLRLIIRDGLAEDIPACLALDHTYETDYVWQVNIHGEPGDWRVSLRKDRLPRKMTVEYPSSEPRLRLTLAPEHGFFVASERETNQTLGYLTLFCNPAHGLAQVTDLVVNAPLRRHGIGTRLLRVARRWAQEREFTRLVAETQTKNYPAIALYQRAGMTFSGYNDQYFANRDIAVFFTQPLR